MEVIHDEDRLLRRVQYLHPTFFKPDGTPTSASFSLKKVRIDFQLTSNDLQHTPKQFKIEVDSDFSLLKPDSLSHSAWKIFTIQLLIILHIH